MTAMRERAAKITLLLIAATLAALLPILVLSLASAVGPFPVAIALAVAAFVVLWADARRGKRTCRRG